MVVMAQGIIEAMYAERDLTFRASIDAANCRGLFPFPNMISSDPYALVSSIRILDGIWRVQLEPST